MGLQDRDYYRKNYKKTQQENSNHSLYTSKLRISKRNSTGLQYLLYPLLTITALWYGADYLPDKIKSRKLLGPASVLPANPKPLDLTPGSISLKTDRQGHFRGTVLINNVPMPFMIDTGATTTVIPAKMAMAADLPLGRSIQARTAGGQVIDRVTRINSLKIGNAEIRNLDAHINEHLDEVLIGMNTLKYFHMMQNGNTLTLVANNQQIRRVTNAQAAALDTFPMQQPMTKPVTVKKTVTCDKHKVCKTAYSDH